MLDLRAARPNKTDRASSGTRTRTPGFGRPGPYLWTMLAIPVSQETRGGAAHGSRTRPLLRTKKASSHDDPSGTHSAATGGVEPPSHRLTGGRSAIELRRNVGGADGERLTEVVTRSCPEGPSSAPAREPSRSRTHLATTRLGRATSSSMPNCQRAGPIDRDRSAC